MTQGSHKNLVTAGRINPRIPSSPLPAQWQVWDVRKEHWFPWGPVAGGYCPSFSLQHSVAMLSLHTWSSEAAWKECHSFIWKPLRAMPKTGERKTWGICTIFLLPFLSLLFCPLSKQSNIAKHRGSLCWPNYVAVSARSAHVRGEVGREGTELLP